MKALFVKCHGKLTTDMLIGGLIDMGVPVEYVKMKLQEATLDFQFIEKNRPSDKIPARYFHVVDKANKPLLLRQGDLFRIWRHICDTVASEWEQIGWKVFSILTAGASDALDEIPANIVGLRRCNVREEDVVSLYCFLACLDYLGVESLFTVPFSLNPGEDEAGKTTYKILIRAKSSSGVPLSPGDIDPFAAAVLEGLSAEFIDMDGRFISEKTTYGAYNPDEITGDNTVALHLGYFNDKNSTIFSRQLKVFGVNVGES